MLPLTALGAGASGENWKTANTHHIIAVESGSWNNFVTEVKMLIHSKIAYLLIVPSHM